MAEWRQYELQAAIEPGGESGFLRLDPHKAARILKDRTDRIVGAGSLAVDPGEAAPGRDGRITAHSGGRFLTGRTRQ